MKCEKCGRENQEGARFCGGCGASLEKKEDFKIQKRKKSGKRKWIIAALSVIAVLVIGIGGSILFQKKKEKDFNDLVASADRYLKKMDYQKAIESYRKILEIDPKRKSAYQGMIQAYYHQGKEDEIESVIAEAEKNISDAETFDEIRYWGKVEERLEGYLKFITELTEKIPQDGFRVEMRRLQTYGLSFLKNIDFNQDGMDELTLAYTDTRSEDYEKVVEYKVEVWAWKKDHMEKVYEGEPFQFNGDGQAVRFVYLEDGTIQLVTGENTTSAITVYYGYTGEKFEEQKTVEADIGTLSVKINGEEVTEQEWEEYSAQYDVSNMESYFLQGYGEAKWYGNYTIDRTKQELEYQLRAAKENYKQAIEQKAEREEREEQIQDGNYITITDNINMYLNVYTEENNKMLEIKYSERTDDAYMEVESLTCKYDKEEGIYKEVAEDPVHMLAIDQEGDIVSVLIKNENTGHQVSVELQREKQYDSVEVHEQYRKVFVSDSAESQDMQGEETEPEDLEVLQESEVDIDVPEETENNLSDLSKDAVAEMVAEHYTSLLPEGDGGSYTIYQHEMTETEQGYDFVLRYCISEEKAKEIINRGGSVQANTLAGTASVNLETGEVTMENSDPWNLNTVN